MHHLAKVAVLRQREEARHRLVDRLVAAVHLRVREHLLRAAELAAAIRSITPEMEARAEAMGRRARDEDGAAAVVRTVEAFLREKVATGEWRDDFQERVVSAYES